MRRWSDGGPKGITFVVSAPSGTGKTTLLQRLRERVGGLRFSVSYTTRPPRPGEEEGRDYHFVSREKFFQMVQEGRFIEWAEVHGDLYGTPKVNFDGLGEEDLLLDIDPQGAKRIKEMVRDSVLIFILPPSLEELERRLRRRGKDSEETIRERLKNAKKELDQIALYDYIVVNDDLEEATLLLCSVIRAERCRRKRVMEVKVRDGQDNR